MLKAYSKEWLYQLCKNSFSYREVLLKAGRKDSGGNDGHWLDTEISLELDHINGVNDDHRISNLRWLCPNCHATTDTYCGKNIKKQKNINFCIDCGKEIDKRSKRCHQCEGIFRKNNSTLPVSREELKNLIRTTPFTKIGLMYSVSDNAIRKWCIKLNLPSKVFDIKNFTDEQWKNI